MMLNFILWCALIGFCYAQNVCVTPDGGTGVCKNIYECPTLIPLATRAVNDTELKTREFQPYVCGYMTVCCPDCFTPDGKSGICKPLNQCPHLIQISTSPTTDSERRYRDYSICPDQMSYCCGPPPVLPLPVGGCEGKMNAFPPDPATECSGVEATANDRIVGGTATELDQYPWLALLEYLIKGKTEVKCGGALISGKYVLTAAHCVTELLPVKVRLGEYDISYPDPNCRGQECLLPDCLDMDCAEPYVSIPIEDIIVHEGYRSHLNDIALIRLKNVAPFTDFIRPISLPSSDVTANSLGAPLRAVVAGWGRVNQTVAQSRTKQHVEVPLVDLQVCQNAYDRVFHYSVITLWSKQLCAGGEPGKDSCNGDSGGPLMMKTSYEGKRIYEVIGVVSFGLQHCGTAGVPGVYTKVYDYLGWIRSKITL